MERNFNLISNEQLQQIVEDVSLRYFEKEFVHKALFNNRLRTTGGRYLLQSHNIEINPKQLIHYGEEALIGIIKHELCHYHLHLEGRGYKHQDNDFKQLLSKVGAPRFCSMVPGTKNKAQSSHQYECEKCGQRYNRKRRIDTKRYVCGKCKGRLKKIS